MNKNMKDIIDMTKNEPVQLADRTSSVRIPVSDDGDNSSISIADNTAIMTGEYIINVLEPKAWDDGESFDGEDVPGAFKVKTKLSQHISFLRNFFRCYKDFSDREIDTIELLLIKLYNKFGITDRTD